MAALRGTATSLRSTTAPRRRLSMRRWPAFISRRPSRRSGDIREQPLTRRACRLPRAAAVDPMTRVEFANASADVLAARGIALDRAASAPQMSEADAAAIASNACGGKRVLEARYARYRCVSRNPPLDRDCWVLSLDPTGFSSTRGIPAEYVLVVVDPVSGAILERGWGASGPSTGPADPRLGAASI